MRSAELLRLAVAALVSVGCADDPTVPTAREDGSPQYHRGGPSAAAVGDLRVVRTDRHTATLSWTQVDDGTGAPASYRVKYATSPITDWARATIGCDRTIDGERTGARITCTVEGLMPSTSYDFQLMSYRVVERMWAGAVYSNVATATTAAWTPRGIWVAPEAIAARERAGPAWGAMSALGSTDCGEVDLSDPERYTHLCVMTHALIYAATGARASLDETVRALADFSGDSYRGSAWVLGREVPAYVIAADLVDLPSYDPSLDGLFRTQLQRLRVTPTDSGPPDLVECHEERPNNWGTHCGAARTAIAAYLDDGAELERVAQVLRGYLGDRTAYADFDFGGPDGDLSWQCDPAAPVGVNPAGCTKDGQPIGGVLPDDQRRGGPFSWPPPKENYVWEGLQGAVVQAVILHNAGYDPFEWSDQALRRAVAWLHEQAAYPAEGDDEWIPHIINHFYGTDFPAPVPANPGKNVAWTEWTHGVPGAGRQR